MPEIVSQYTGSASGPRTSTSVPNIEVIALVSRSVGSTGVFCFRGISQPSAYEAEDCFCYRCTGAQRRLGLDLQMSNDPLC